MTTLKLDGSPSVAAAEVLAPHVPMIYGDPRKRFVAIVEFAHSERTQPAPDSEKNPSVKVRLTSIEIPVGVQVDRIREAQRALFLVRTAQGTLTEELDLELSQGTLDRLGEELQHEDNVRLMAGIKAWCDYAAAALSQPKPTAGSLAKDIRAIRDGLRALVKGVDQQLPEVKP